MSSPDPRAEIVVLAIGLSPEDESLVRRTLARSDLRLEFAGAVDGCGFLPRDGDEGPAAVLVIADADSAERALAAGAEDVVVLPLRPALILHRVERALAHRAAFARLGNGLSRVDHDTLTGLPGRDGLLHALARSIDGSRSTGELVALLLLELDLDALDPDGPGSRDAALVALAGRLRESVRDRDTVGHLGSRLREVSLARLGGERFAVLLPGLPRPQDAFRIAQRIQVCLARPLPGRDAGSPSCFGIAISPADAETAPALLSAAEDACARARGEGAGLIRFSAEAMNASALERLTLESSLRRALERDEIVVHYQPRVEIATGRVAGVEALARWQHPEMGLVPPGRFIPIAEETGLITPIGERVLAIACEAGVRWREAGLPPVRMAVNLSSVQFRQPDLAERIADVLRATGLEPDGLELELTETVLLSHADATVARLRDLERMGIHLSIDDFGTGYSSLSYLKRFPIDALKIDQSFIREITTNPDDAAITTSILLMGRSLGLKVVAEGVETQKQLDFLRVLGCDEAQGFLFSRAVPEDEAAALIAKVFGRCAAA